jgi:2-methylcitrate dehydratase
VDKITHEIAEYSSASTFGDLTDESVHAATQRLIDSLGCALGAYDCEPAQIGRRLAPVSSSASIPAVFFVSVTSCRPKRQLSSIRR